MKNLNSVQKGVKAVQAVCAGVLTLGVSLMASDAAGMYKLPFSSLSITTTTFGLVGVIVTEVVCHQAARWAEEDSKHK